MENLPASLYFSQWLAQAIHEVGCYQISIELLKWVSVVFLEG